MVDYSATSLPILESLNTPEQLQRRLKELEKQNRILQKKLERAEFYRLELENSHEIQSQLMTQTIQGLEKSRLESEKRNRELQEALHNLKMMQSKLVESEKMSALGVLVAGIAHEINNPTNFIHANIEHAYAYVQSLIEILHLYQTIYPEPVPAIVDRMEQLDLDFILEDLPKLLDSMKLGSDRICKIVLGLRTFSRLDESDYKEANLHDGLDSTLMILQHRLKGHHHYPKIMVVKDYGYLPKIPCFSGQLNQVFMNILVNAIDAIEELQAQCHDQQLDCEAGCIFIQTAVIDQWVKIVIRDNGIGMSEVAVRRIFDPFYTTKPVGKGTGMGLAISYQIVVENHGGKLDCTSQPGKGTQFVIQIPINTSSQMVRQ